MGGKLINNNLHGNLTTLQSRIHKSSTCQILNPVHFAMKNLAISLVFEMGRKAPT